MASALSLTKCALVVTALAAASARGNFDAEHFARILFQACNLFHLGPLGGTMSSLTSECHRARHSQTLAR